MFQLKFRRAAASAALLCALSLLPADAALAARSPRSQRPQAPVAAPVAGTFWDFVTGLVRKFGSVINPDGRDARITSDSNVNRADDPDGAQ
jgi:hypothetical protein